MSHKIVHYLHRFFSRFTLGYFLVLTTIFNSVAPALFLATPVHAADSQSVGISYSPDSHNFTLSGPTSTSYHLYYQTPTKMDGAQGTLPATVYAGTQSAGVGTPETVERGIYKTDSVTEYFVIDGSTLRSVVSTATKTSSLTDADTAWLADPATYGDLVTGTTYHAPFNQDVSVSFTSLPSTPGTITFHQISLTDAQVKESGALTSTAYEITSNMSDGTFTYDLTLPNPSKKTNVSVQYSEDGKTFNSAASVSAAPSVVTIPGLTHFTIFVVVYDATPSVSPVTSYPSLGFQATQTSEFGDYVHLAGTTRLLSKVTVTMVTWAKYSTYSSNPLYMSNSISWTHPITINVYGSHLGSNGVPDQLLATTTETITIPWRPEGNSACADPSKWMDSNGNCNNGYAFNAIFDMSSPRVTLPDDVIVGIAYNTQSYGIAPLGVDGPYNSLNVAVPDNQTVAVGSDDSVSEVFWNTVTKAWYTDGGAAGFGVFRKDTNWSPNGTVAFKVETLAIPSCNSSTFDSFTLGSVNGQGGWSITGSYDQAIVNNNYGYSTFGCKTLRISDSTTSGSFGDQLFAAPVTNGVGETSATASSFALGTRQNHFETQFDIASAVPGSQQPGMHISISPDRGDGSRMSYLRVEDNASGLDFFFDDVQGTNNPANFVETQIATGLDRSVPHTIKIAMDFVEGPSNDVVKVWIDGTLVHTGTSWENYYRYDSEASTEQSPRIVKTVLFRESGDATPADSGKGFLIDSFTDISSIIAPDVPSLVSPADGAHVQPTGLVLDWTDSSSLNLPVTYRYQSSYSAAVGAHNGLVTPIYNTNTGTDSQINASGSADNLYYWQAQACDSVNNCSDWSGPWAVNIDGTAPTVSLTSPITSLLHGSVDIRGTVQDANPDHYYTVVTDSSNNVVAGPGTVSDTSSFIDNLLFTWNTLGVVDGAYTIRLEARDAAGNKDAGSVATKSVTVDNTAPTVISVSSDGSTYNLASGDPTIKVTFSEPVTKPTITVHSPPPGNLQTVTDCGDEDPTTYCFTYHLNNEEVSHTIYISGAADLAGNVMGQDTSHTFIVDRIAPSTIDNADGNWHNGSVTVTLACTDAGSGCDVIYFTTDGSTPTSSHYTGTGSSVFLTSDGVYPIKYFGVDHAGNAEDVKTSANTVKIDIIAPLEGSISYTDGYYITTLVPLTLDDGTDFGSGIDTASRIVQRQSSVLTNGSCGEFGGSWNAITPTGDYPDFTDTTVADGNCYQYRYLISDNATNQTTYSSENTAKIDITAPAQPIANPAAGDYLTDQSVALSSSDTGSGLADIYYTTDGTTPDNTSTLYSAPITVDHDLTLKAIAYDNADNASGILTAVYGITPIISGESSNTLTDTHATITWTTDDPSTSRVVYDTVSHPSLAAVPNYGYANSTVEDPTKVTNHTVLLVSLTANTTYYYRVISHGSPEAVGAEQSFGTTAAPSKTNNDGGTVLGASTPAFCNDIKPGSTPHLLSAITGVNSITLTWSVASDPTTYYLVAYGDKPGLMQYGNPNVGGSGTTSYTVNNLSGGTLYYFQVRAGNGCTPGDFSNELSARPGGQFIAAPATGFAPDVLGAETIASPSPSISPTPSVTRIAVSTVLGAATVSTLQTLVGQWWFWLLIIVITFSIIYLLYRRWFAKSH